MQFSLRETILLTVSAFLFAYLVTDLLRPAPAACPREVRVQGPIQMLLADDTVPDDVKDDVRFAVRRGLPSLRDAALTSRRATRDFQRVLSADDFDPVVAAEMAGLAGDARRAQWLASSSIAVDVFSELPDDVRLAFVRERQRLNESN